MGIKNPVYPVNPVKIININSNPSQLIGAGSGIGIAEQAVVIAWLQTI